MEWHNKQQVAEEKEKKWIARAERARWATRARLAKMSMEEYQRSVRPLSVRREKARNGTAAWARATAVMSDVYLLLGLAGDF